MTARAILPEIHSNCEFELLIHHPDVFPLLDLSTAAQLAGSTLISTTSSLVGDSGLSRLPSSVPRTDNTSSFRQVEDSFSVEHLDGNEPWCDSSSVSEAHYFDPRLLRLNIGFWTNVPISNEQAAGDISMYFEVQHHVWGIFDAGLFVRDLIDMRFEFCSPFLVSSLLAIASVSYSLLRDHN